MRREWGKGGRERERGMEERNWRLEYEEGIEEREEMDEKGIGK